MYGSVCRLECITSLHTHMWIRLLRILTSQYETVNSLLVGVNCVELIIWSGCYSLHSNDREWSVPPCLFEICLTSISKHERLELLLVWAYPDIVAIPFSSDPIRSFYNNAMDCVTVRKYCIWYIHCLYDVVLCVSLCGFRCVRCQNNETSD